jgi:hypothetical protein
VLYARNTHIDQFDIMPALLQVLLHQGQIIVLVWHDAKGEAISNAEDTNCSWGFMRAELNVVEASGIEVKIPKRRKRLAPESIGVHYKRWATDR